MNRKFIYALCIITLLTICFIWFSGTTVLKSKEQSTHQSRETKSDNKVEDQSSSPIFLNTISEEKLWSQLMEKCDDLKNLEPAKNRFPTSQLARNIHFKRDGEIFRLRTFLEDGGQQSYKKLVLFKEDNDGFPQYQKVPKEDQVNPSSLVINRYLLGSEIIYDEMDNEITLSRGEIRYTLLNGKIVKILAPSFNCNFEE